MDTTELGGGSGLFYFSIGALGILKVDENDGAG